MQMWHLVIGFNYLRVFSNPKNSVKYFPGYSLLSRESKTYTDTWSIQGEVSWQGVKPPQKLSCCLSSQSNLFTLSDYVVST